MRSLAAALKDFGAPRLAASEPFAMPPGFPPPQTFPEPDFPVFEAAPSAEPRVDVDALVAEAVGRAEAALAERLAQEHADALRTERDRHAEEMGELQSRFAAQASSNIQAAIEDMEKRVVELTSAVTARILGVVLTDDIRQRSIARLADIIREALADDDAVRIRVRGSLPLYEELAAKLPAHAEQFDFSEGPDFDLSVTIDDSMFETRLAEWSSALAETLS